MDFFEHQEKARKNTFKLLFLYALCILGIVLCTYPFALFFFLKENFTYYARNCSTHNFSYNYCSALIRPDVFFETLVAILILVILGALFKLLGLMQGGAAVATSLGGRLVDRNTRDPKEKRLLNIVEEMALASGIAVPDTYVLDREMAINAFAAGFSPKDAVVAVTRGTLETLNRDGLQGVMGHEFSHILNGDMRLNIRLIALLNGILIVALLGRLILDLTYRSSIYDSYDRRDRDDNRGNSPLGPILGLGLALYVLGYLGVFFASIIKSAVSRQREFLADASSVQFTRNPDGLASALSRIGGFNFGSKVKNARAEEVSHMFFADGYSSVLHFLFATHPPLDERIKRINPNLILEAAAKQAMPESGDISGQSPLAAGFAGGTSAPVAAQEVVDKIGNFGEEEVAKAANLVNSIPQALQSMTREIASAQALLLALLLNKEGSARDNQLARAEERGFTQLVLSAEKMLQGVDESKYIHLVELSIPTIKILPASFIERFISDLRFFSEADSQLTLFEYTVVVMVQSSTKLIRGERPLVENVTELSSLQEDVEILLSAISYSGSQDRDLINQAFNQAAAALNMNLTLLAESVCTLPKIDNALTNLSSLVPLRKKDLIKAVVFAINSDQKIAAQEAQLLRAICYLLDCPLPILN